MPNYVRWREAGGTYFFTVVTQQRRRILHGALAREALRRSIKLVKNQWPFEMFACVLLPDHLHCIWMLPENDQDFSLRWANIKRLFTQQYLALGGPETSVTESRSRRHERGVWQPRYWEHRIRNEKELFAYRDYIHLNPVKHGYTNDPLDWPWSTVHQHLRSGWLSSDWSAWTPISVQVVGE